MEFIVPNKPGIYILAGSNGSGKTTLLTALYRLCNSQAFLNGFKETTANYDVDSYCNSEIEYTAQDGSSVKYKKKRQRWAPTPRKNASVLEAFGFKTGFFIKADGSRLTPKNDEIRNGPREPADTQIKTILKELFRTEKYDKLERLKNTNGKGANSTFFYIIKDGKRYYSEKRFSTGELAMIQLAEVLGNIPENSLLLLDEGELALHPTVQHRLINLLEKVSKEKKVTVFISTHSPSMLRAASPNNIYFLEGSSEDKVIKTVNPCYPAYAIGYLDDLDFDCDGVICVEDEPARIVARHLIDYHFSGKTKPNIKIIPIAGYIQTIDFVRNSKNNLFRNCRICAVLDHDVFDPKEPSYTKKLKYIEASKVDCCDLGITFEVALVEFLERGDDTVNRWLCDNLGINIKTIQQDEKYIKLGNTKQHPRAVAKEKLKFVMEQITNAGCVCIDVAKDRILSQYIVEIYGGENNLKKASGIIASKFCK